MKKLTLRSTGRYAFIALVLATALGAIPAVFAEEAAALAASADPTVLVGQTDVAQMVAVLAHAAVCVANDDGAGIEQSEVQVGSARRRMAAPRSWRGCAHARLSQNRPGGEQVWVPNLDGRRSQGCGACAAFSRAATGGLARAHWVADL